MSLIVLFWYQSVVKVFYRTQVRSWHYSLQSRPKAKVFSMDPKSCMISPPLLALSSPILGLSLFTNEPKPHWHLCRSTPEGWNRPIHAFIQCTSSARNILSIAWFIPLFPLTLRLNFTLSLNHYFMLQLASLHPPFPILMLDSPSTPVSCITF